MSSQTLLLTFFFFFFCRHEIYSYFCTPTPCNLYSPLIAFIMPQSPFCLLHSPPSPPPSPLPSRYIFVISLGGGVTRHVRPPRVRDRVRRGVDHEGTAAVGVLPPLSPPQARPGREEKGREGMAGNEMTRDTGQRRGGAPLMGTE